MWTVLLFKKNALAAVRRMELKEAKEKQAVKLGSYGSGPGKIWL